MNSVPLNQLHWIVRIDPQIDGTYKWRAVPNHADIVAAISLDSRVVFDNEADACLHWVDLAERSCIENWTYQEELV